MAILRIMRVTTSMKELQGLSIRHLQNSLELLDQQKLPHQEEWIPAHTLDQIIFCIKELKVRGAPAIGVASALFLAKYAEQGATPEEFIQAARKLEKSRPTAINLKWAIDSLLKLTEPYRVAAIVAKAEEIFEQDTLLCQKIGLHGASLIRPKDRILTYCNTGGLATAGRGTALGIIQTAHEQNKDPHVFVCETRPLLQGGQLTTWELTKLNIPHTLICDNMAATLMATQKIDKVIVGADRIACNGDFANKIGTYSLAVSAHFHGIPFYVAAPHSSVDKNCPNGDDIPIEQRAESEVKGAGSLQWAPAETQAYNPAFDVTPHQLVTAWILDEGIQERVFTLKPTN